MADGQQELPGRQPQGVVVTGLGMVSALGRDTEECWRAVRRGAAGIRPVDVVDTAGLITRLGGQAPLKDEPGTDRCFTLARAAALEAADHSGLPCSAYAPERVGVVVGSSLGTTRSIERFHAQWRSRGLRHADVRLLKGYALHSVADLLAARLGFTGPRALMSNACAAGAVAIGYALELLWSDEADAVLVGGVDPLTGLSFHGFNSLGALDPAPCAPYTRSAGLSLGEGAGFLVLERRDAALARGAGVVCEIAGYGLSADAHHQTAPDPGGKGASRAIAAAVASAGHELGDVDYINGHGTGTPTNDCVEPKAIRLLFDPPPPVSSTKSMIGHTLGAAGAIEAVVCALAVREGVQPPTANTAGVTRSPSGLDIIPEVAALRPAGVVVSNSFAFGGNNAAVVLRDAERGGGPPPAAVAAVSPRRVYITGIAGLAGSAAGHDALLAALHDGVSVYGERVEVPGYGSRPAGVVDLTAATAGVNPSVLRRMDPTSRLAAAAVAELHRRHGRPDRARADTTGLIFGTGLAPITPVEQFHRGVLNDGAAGANPRYFPNTVVNAAAGHLAILHRFRGPTATVSTGGTSALTALHYGSRLIARGAADRVVVVVADECPAALLAGHVKIPGFLSDTEVRPFGGDGTVLGAGAVAITLESSASAQDSGAEPLATVGAFGLASDDSGIAGLRPDGEAWSRSLRGAVDAAGITADDVGMVVCAAMGRPAVDDTEAAALRGAGLASRPLVAPKAVLGETSGSAPGLGLLAAVAALGDGRVPGARGVGPAPEGLPGLVPRGGVRSDVRHALISGFAYGGSYVSLVVSKEAVR
ncbi:beta-ketoacyl synthase N-terminal-like domain-containing protein [Streptomyces sp. NPDC101393]|uniref:beta-ketoacyl synthase N-terminal-like domain-containing protein n=1 Tax=Streptomyces sp. NPDC101393 TaxID=3366141 RepID=UPI00380BA9F9